jgi:hypothetical protein
MTAAAGWLADPTGAHEVRYWDGQAWTEHVGDRGATAVDPVPAGAPLPPPPGAALPPPPPEPAAPAASGKGSWKDRLKSVAQQAAQQGKQVAEQAKGIVGEQQAKRLEQWRDDPDTIWSGRSQGAASKATGMSKAMYRLTTDRLWIDSGLLGVRSEHVPLWAVKDIDVRQNVLQRGKDVGDVVLWLEDPLYGVAGGGAFSLTGDIGHEPGGGHTSGEVVVDNITEPYKLRDVLLPLVSAARSKKLVERQTQYLHVNPGVAAVPGGIVPGGMVPGAVAPAAPVVDLADQLRKLAELRDQGILTEDEFAAQKAKLLGA